MKLLFFKARVFASLMMILTFVTCAVILPRTKPTRVQHPTEEVKQKSIVIIYSAEWCALCTKAKAFMEESNIKFIEKDPENAKHFKELTDLAKKIGVDTKKLNAVPIFIIKNKIIIGFNHKEILCILSGKACDTDFTRFKEKF